MIPLDIIKPFLAINRLKILSALNPKMVNEEKCCKISEIEPEPIALIDSVRAIALSAACGERNRPKLGDQIRAMMDRIHLGEFSSKERRIL